MHGTDSLPLAGRVGVGGWMAKDLARKLRRNATYAEHDFWRLTWTWRQAGWPFRRQQLIGTYYVDFACIKAGLVVEIDGDTHGADLAQSNDASRDDYLLGRGFTVMRFSNLDLSTNPEGVFDVVSAYLESRALIPPPQPSPRGVGGRIVRSPGDEDDL
jgi:very-short-patch-repair endonuclease